MVSGVDHVAIAAKDSRALTQWYCDVLGLRVLFDNGKDPPTCLVGGDMGGVVEIMPDNGAAVTVHQPLDPGIRHIAFRVRDFESAYANLEGKVLGLMPPGPAAGGGQVAFFHDPEGNLIQIVSRDQELY
jgi:glyoxylase I family protein